MRGEHEAPLVLIQTDEGSSPHARGTQTGLLHVEHPVGIIPACAGNTISASSKTRASRDHPRMRGEHLGQDIAFMQTKGSSPHARGTRSLSIRQAAIRRDHPRMRGEHWMGWASTWMAGGSSPHARGTHGEVTDGMLHGGIIPACAGNTGHASGCGYDKRDHPRMRGEHMARGCSVCATLGSSPHARGTL